MLTITSSSSTIFLLHANNVECQEKKSLQGRRGGAAAPSSALHSLPLSLPHSSVTITYWPAGQVTVSPLRRPGTGSSRRERIAEPCVEPLRGCGLICSGIFGLRSPRQVWFQLSLKQMVEGAALAVGRSW